MIGALITFFAVLLIVACYMSIVHRFLKSAEEPGDFPEPARNRRARGEEEFDRIGRVTKMEF